MDGGLSAGGPLEVFQGHLLQPHVFLGGVGGAESHLKQKLKISLSLSKVHVGCSRIYVSVTNLFHRSFFSTLIYLLTLISWCG